MTKIVQKYLKAKKGEESVRFQPEMSNLLSKNCSIGFTETNCSNYFLLLYVVPVIDSKLTQSMALHKAQKKKVINSAHGTYGRASLSLL